MRRRLVLFFFSCCCFSSAPKITTLFSLWVWKSSQSQSRERRWKQKVPENCLTQRWFDLLFWHTKIRPKKFFFVCYFSIGFWKKVFLDLLFLGSWCFIRQGVVTSKCHRKKKKKRKKRKKNTTSNPFSTSLQCSRHGKIQLVSKSPNRNVTNSPFTIQARCKEKNTSQIVLHLTSSPASYHPRVRQHRCSCSDCISLQQKVSVSDVEAQTCRSVVIFGDRV